MRKTCTGVIAGVAGVVLLSALAAAQSDAPRSPWKYYPEDVRANAGPGGPAPKRDLTGTWAGPNSGAGVQGGRGRAGGAPPLTPLGKQLNDKMLPLGIYSPAGSNDPYVRYCDPMGFPRNMSDEIRGMTITTLPNRTFVLLMFMNIWREIWTDGRALPTNFGGGAGTPTIRRTTATRWVAGRTTTPSWWRQPGWPRRPGSPGAAIPIASMRA